MILEKAIQQTKFKNANHKVILNLVYTAGLVQAEQARFFKQYDLSPQQYNVLRILRGQHPNPVCVGLVQERMLDQMSNASRLIEKLKLKNLLTRKECKEDRRQVDVVITNAGLDLLSEIDKEFDKFEAYINCLNTQEANELNALLDKLANQF
jgi:DNA-binding MarR family transcriptional regulator